MFLTEEEKAIVEFLKESPKQYREIIKKLKEEKLKKDRRTVNPLLNELVAKKLIFRIQIDKKVFFKLNIFPAKIQRFFNLVDQSQWQELIEIKNEVLRNYPAIPFENILKRHRAYLSLSKPELKGIIKILKDFEGDTYEHPF
jgi:predicted transcriptional regulator